MHTYLNTLLFFTIVALAFFGAGAIIWVQHKARRMAKGW